MTNPNVTRLSEEELASAFSAFEGAGPESEGLLLELGRRYPGDARAHFLIGAFLERAGRYPEALPALDRVLDLEPDHVHALGAKALVLQALGRSEDACRLLDQATLRLPDSGALWANLGVMREAAGDFAAALDAYDRALSKPDAPFHARLNRGYVLTRLLRLPAALENNLILAASHPQNADAHFNVAEVMLALHRYDDAIEACDRALAVVPTHPKARIDRAIALAALGKVDDAQKTLDDVAQSHPQALAEFNLGFSARAGGILQEFDARSIYFHLGFELLDQCQWAGRDELVGFVRGFAGKQGAKEISDPNIPFRTLGMEIDQRTQSAIARGVANAVERHVSNQAARGSMAGRPIRSRVRIAYVSPDFRIHPAAYLTRQLYKGHDRSRFEVFGYGIAPSDGSEIAREIRLGFDVFRDVSNFDSAAIARQIRSDDIDILIDLAGYTNFSRSEAFALRPAPVQVSWLGYPGTLGASYIDYALVDRNVCPEGADQYWSEKLVRLPNTYFISDDNPHRAPAIPTRTQLGLPAEGIVFCCFNNAWKIEPRMFSVWMDLLAKVPGSVLWMLAFRPEVSGNLQREAAARNVDPRRLVFGERLPNESHLLRYRLADIFLDTLHYNAHTTAIDALREDTPVVTVPGETMPSRVAASLLSAAGVPELICKDLQEYREKALRLARNPEELAGVRTKLRDNRGRAPLFDTARFIRNLETAFELMWDRHRKGLPPQAFDVQEIAPRSIRNRWH